MDFEALDVLCNKAAKCLNENSIWRMDDVRAFVAEYARQRQGDLNKIAAEAVARVGKLEDRMDVVEKYCHSHVLGIPCGFVPANFSCARDGDREMSKILDKADGCGIRGSRVDSPRSASEYAYEQDPQRYKESKDVFTAWQKDEGFTTGVNSKGVAWIKRQDDDELISEEWLLSVGFKTYYRPNPAVTYGFNLPNTALSVVSFADKSAWISEPYRIVLHTRRDLRLLCELLKIELKEGK